MKPTSLSSLFKFVYKILKFTGYHFFTFEIDHLGNVLQKFTISDLILFVISTVTSFTFGLFVKYGLNLDRSINSGIIEWIVANFTNISIFLNSPMKISYFLLGRKLLSLMKDLKVCTTMVSF